MSENKKKNKMERGLTNRHVQVMAIAGTIGTGLFLGAGRSISLTGPSIILIYMITGAFMFFDDEGCWGDAVSGSRTAYLYQLYHPSFGERLGIFLSLVLLAVSCLYRYGRNHCHLRLCPLLVPYLA